MSVKELLLKEGSTRLYVKHINEGCFTLDIYEAIYDKAKQIGLDRSQAHLLMLYLQEHLALPAVSDDLDKAIGAELKDRSKDIMG